MSKDIAGILDGWDFESDEVSVRIVDGDDGKQKVQLRIDMGLLQMEVDGRPDGMRPNDEVSWLDYYQKRQRTHDASHPDSASFELNDEACRRLWREGVQFYHRYLSFWHLELYELCARDTERNLQLFAFVREHARSDRNKLQFEQWRPYVLMMNARSVATPLLAGGKFADALEKIDGAISAIRDFLDEYDQSANAEECFELVSLQRWREEVLAEHDKSPALGPQSEIIRLRRRLQQAVAAEDFEQAARLRDEIRDLGPAGEH